MLRRSLLLAFVLCAVALLSVQAAARCETPRPFTPPETTAPWRDPERAERTRAFGPPNHRGRDAIVVAGAPQLLIGKFAYGVADKDLKGEEVDVYVQDDTPCGEWRLLGTGVTSEDGEHSVRAGVVDDGGRVFFSVPTEERLPLGRHAVRMLVRGDHSVAAFTVVA